MSAALAKAAKLFIKKLLTDPEGTKEVVKKIVVIVCSIFFMILLIPALVLSQVGLIGKTGGATEITKNVELTDTKIYQEISGAYCVYIQSLEEKVDKKIEEAEKKYPGVKVEKKKEVSSFASVLAYVTILHYEEEKWIFDKKELVDFLDEAIYIQEKIDKKKEPVIYEISLKCLSEKEIAQKFFTDQEDKDKYLASYESFKGYKANQEVVEDIEILPEKDIDKVTYENGMPIPHFLQYAPQWGSKKYGSGTVTTSGCGPTSMAMVISYFTGKTITPNITAQWADANGYYVPGQGTAWSFYSAAAKNWGIKCQELGNSITAAVQALRENKPVIASMGPGEFTRAGHLIVLRGLTTEGRILVNDPNDSTSKGHYNKAYEPSFIASQAKQYRCFSK